MGSKESFEIFERKIIDSLCDKILPGFFINQELLYNWQLELAGSCDSIDELIFIVENNIVVTPCIDICPSSSIKDHIIILFEELRALADEIYHDFKAIIMEIMIYGISVSYRNRISMFEMGLTELVIDNFITSAKSSTAIYDKDSSFPSNINQLGRLLSIFSEFGFEVNYLRKLVYPLFNEEISVCCKQSLQGLLRDLFSNNVFSSYLYVIPSFQDRSISIPVSSDNSFSKCFTISATFKIHTISKSRESAAPISTLFKLSEASGETSSLKIQLMNMNQIIVEVEDKRISSILTFSFNQILQFDLEDTQNYVSVALTYDSSFNLNLYINGEYSESIPCPQLFKFLESWDRAYIGSSDKPGGFGSNFHHGYKDELILRNLLVLSTDISSEWINFLYNLGPEYSWDFKYFSESEISNALNHLTYMGSFKLIQYIQKLHDETLREFSPTNVSKFNSEIAESKRSHAKYPSVKSNDRNMVIRSLYECRKTGTKVMLNSDDRCYFHKCDREMIRILNLKSMHDAMNSIGGCPLLLRLVEVTSQLSLLNDSPDMRYDMLHSSIKLLFTIVSNNWVFCKEFENLHGYGILSILLVNFKERYFLKQDIKDIESNNSGFENLYKIFPENIFNLILLFGGYNVLNVSKSAVINKDIYRSILFNFDLFGDVNSTIKVLNVYTSLLTESSYSDKNREELSKMKFLRRLFQFLNTSEISDERRIEEVTSSLKSVLQQLLQRDRTAESLKMMSLFIVYSLYHPACKFSEMYALSSLEILLEVTSNKKISEKILRKFSKSISVHWLLLLLDYESTYSSFISAKIRHSGLRLLTRILKYLGSQVTKKFFQINRGLDVLTQILRKSWQDEEIISQLYLSAFEEVEGIPNVEGMPLTQILSNNDISARLNYLVLPELLNLLNNIAISSILALEESNGKVLSSPKNSISNGDDLDLAVKVLHLITQYVESIKVGYENIEAIQLFYRTPEWCEGICELLAHLDMIISWEGFDLRPEFESVFESLRRTISSILLSTSIPISHFFKMFDKLDDITKKIILEYIFPLLFEHASHFLASDVQMLDISFFESNIQLLNYYHSNFIKEKFEVKASDLKLYLECNLNLIDQLQQNSNLNISHNKYKQAKRSLGDAILMSILKHWNPDKPSFMGKISDAADDISTSHSFNSSNFSKLVKWLLCKSATILQRDVLESERIAEIFTILLHRFLIEDREVQEESSAYLFNFLRTSCLMFSKDIKQIAETICHGSEMKDARSLVLNFLECISSRNDDEVFRILHRYPAYSIIFGKRFSTYLTNDDISSTLKVSDMISVMLKSGGRMSQINNVYVNTFQKDCENYKVSILNGEITKINRSNQDKLENIKFFVSSYNSMKLEVSRLVGLIESGKITLNPTLDYVENIDRMRKRMIPENQLAESEKLSYNIEIPIKILDENLSTPVLNNFSDSINTFSNLDLGNKDTLDSQDEAFQVIDESLEVSSSEIDVAPYDDKNRKVIRSLYLGDQIAALWNVSQINGLVPVESLMILGVSFIYIIENYFLCKDGNVIDIQDAAVEERDPYLHLINSQSKILMNENLKQHRSKSWELEKLSSISKRQFLLRDIAIEMFFSDGANILITFITPKERDLVFQKLSTLCTGKGLDPDLLQVLRASSSFSTNHSLNVSTSLFTSRLASAFAPSTLTTLTSAAKNWRMGRLSNFYFLMIINTLAGRTFTDLTQYPVFPWIIADYKSETLDLNNPKTFRDLSKPMGAQSPYRAKEFQKRYEALESLNDKNSPPFHYGTHYSSAMIVTSYLIRLRPYVQSYLLLQGGKFDHADRLFNSIEKAWISASSENTTDVRELIPEFFFLPEFLSNSNNFEFGKLQDGSSSNDVVLPIWAKGDPKLFIGLQREALECSYVSANLHSWIELIFGHKQSGPEAVKALNVFHHFSYNGAINLDSISDDVEKRAIIGMINNFGQTPLKVFNKSISPKETLNWPNKYLELVDNSKRPKLIFESKHHLPIAKIEQSLKTRTLVGRPKCVSSDENFIIRKANPSRESSSIIINDINFNRIHQGNITCILQIGHKCFLTASSNGTINIWKCFNDHSPNLEFLQVLRGHFTEIKQLVYSRNFLIAASLDLEGHVIMWDLSRYKYIRRIDTEATIGQKNIVSISEDTGNIGILNSHPQKLELNIFTINGELIIKKTLSPGKVSSMNFATINFAPLCLDSKQVTRMNHFYWSSEIIAVCYYKPVHVIDIFELSLHNKEQPWSLNKLQSLNLASSDIGRITTIEIVKTVDISKEERLSRGKLSVLIGDSKGRVYSW